MGRPWTPASTWWRGCSWALCHVAILSRRECGRLWWAACWCYERAEAIEAKRGVG